MRLNTKLANCLNVMYQDVVNNHVVVPANNEKYLDAEDFVKTYYSKLNDNVLEYLAAYMAIYPEGKIQFMPGKQSVVELSCRFDDRLKVLSYNENGIIVNEEEAKITQKGEL